MMNCGRFLASNRPRIPMRAFYSALSSPDSLAGWVGEPIKPSENDEHDEFAYGPHAGQSKEREYGENSFVVLFK